MNIRAEQLSADDFAAIWNAAGSVDEVVVRVRERVGPPVPRWSVLARAAAVRKAGAKLKRFDEPAAARG